MRRNIDIREAIKNAGIPYWLVAEKMGIHENTLYRILRKKLGAEEKKELIKSINEAQKVNEKG